MSYGKNKVEMMVLIFCGGERFSLHLSGMNMGMKDEEGMHRILVWIFRSQGQKLTPAIMNSENILLFFSFRAEDR